MASLDPESAEGVLTLLRDITREREMTVLCSLHQPALAERSCDTIRALQVRGEPEPQEVIRVARYEATPVAPLFDHPSISWNARPHFR